MTPLSNAARELVAANVDLAALVADEFRARILDRDERISSAQLGLCLAAAQWDGTGCFRAYARTRARWQVSVDIRAAWRRRKNLGACDDLSVPLPPADLSALPDRRDPYAVMDIQDEADSVRRHLHRIKPRHREVLALHCRGESTREIGSRYGISPDSAGELVRRAAASLRKAVNAAAFATPRATVS